MTNLSQAEEAALASFAATPGLLKSALEKFFNLCIEHHQQMCAACMATVPRDHERAADHAAKAQVLEEFWSLLSDHIMNSVMPSQEPTQRGVEE